MGATIHASRAPMSSRAFQNPCVGAGALDALHSIAILRFPFSRTRSIPAPSRHLREHVFDHHAFPGMAEDGVSQKIIPALDVEKGVEDAGVSEVNLRRLHQALGGAGQERRLDAHHEGAGQHLDICARGRVADPERGAELREVQDLPVMMGAHPPQALDRRCGYRDSQLGGKTPRGRYA